MKNNYFISGDVAVIEAFNRSSERYFYILIDAEDLPLIIENAKSISINRDTYTNYATYRCKHENKTKLLHRLVMDTPLAMTVDHLDYNGLNNRKRNLENCTFTENNRRRRKKAPVSSHIHERNLSIGLKFQVFSALLNQQESK